MRIKEKDILMSETMVYFVSTDLESQVYMVVLVSSVPDQAVVIGSPKGQLVCLLCLRAGVTRECRQVVINPVTGIKINQIATKITTMLKYLQLILL